MNRKRNLKIEKNIETIHKRDLSYHFCDYTLKENSKLFDPDTYSRNGEIIQKKIDSKYYSAIKDFFLDYKIIVRLSGLHFRIDEYIKNNYFNGKKRTNVILNFHSWTINQKDPESYNEEFFVLIECEKKIFKEFFKKFWFSLGREIHFEVFFIKPEKIFYFEKWSRQKDGQRKFENLINASELILDNCCNGFHFRAITKIFNKNIFDNLEPKL